MDVAVEPVVDDEDDNGGDDDDDDDDDDSDDGLTVLAPRPIVVTTTTPKELVVVKMDPVDWEFSVLEGVTDEETEVADKAAVGDGSVLVEVIVVGSVLGPGDGVVDASAEVLPASLVRVSERDIVDAPARLLLESPFELDELGDSTTVRESEVAVGGLEVVTVALLF